MRNRIQYIIANDPWEWEITRQPDSSESWRIDAMRIDYELTLDDQMAGHHYFVHTSLFVRRNYQKNYVQSMVVSFFVALALWWFFSSFHFNIGVVIGTIITTGVAYVIFPGQFWRNLDKNFLSAMKDHPQLGIIGKHTIVIDPQGFTESTEVNESRIQWIALDRVEQD